MSLNLDDMIATRIGQLTMQTAKQAILIETLKLELTKRDREIAEMKAKVNEMRTPELPLEIRGEANGKSH